MEKEEMIQKYKIYQPKIFKKNLTHSEMICHICSSPDYEEDNQIVFCSICNISLH